MTESDPNGTQPHEAGAKLDAGKPMIGLVMAPFGLALREVAKVGTYGAKKYSRNGWESVPDGVNRYTDAMYRHLLIEHQQRLDADTNIMHAAHAAWNALARLELMLREVEINHVIER